MITERPREVKEEDGTGGWLKDGIIQQIVLFLSLVHRLSWTDHTVAYIARAPEGANGQETLEQRHLSASWHWVV